jgi:hypothetical protein
MKTIAVCVLGITLIALAVWYRPADADDFAPFYRAATLASAHESVYANPSWSPESGTDGRFLPYLRIPSYAGALTPLARLPYARAREVWVAMSVLAVFACVWLFPAAGRNGLAIALAFSFPLCDALMVGQDIGFVLLIVLAAAWIYSGGREFLAGLVASLLAIKITYLPAAGVVFLAKSRRGLWGFLTGTAIQLALSFPAGGAGWPIDFVAMLRSPLLDPEPSRMMNVRALVNGLPMPAVLFAVAAVGLYAAFWFACRRFTVEDGLIAGLALAMIATPHSKVYDGVVLIPLFVRVASLRSWEGLLAFLCLMPGFYLMVLMGTPRATLGGSLLIVFASVAAGVRLYRKSGVAVPEFSALATVAQAG